MGIKKTIRINGHRQNQGFKISFNIEYEHNEGDDANNTKRAINEARKEARRLNKLYKFRGKERMMYIGVLDEVIMVY